MEPDESVRISELFSASTAASRVYADPAFVEAWLRDFALPPGPLLDFGCGAGALTYELARLYPGRRVTGIDLTPKQIERASSFYRANNLEYRLGDGYRGLVAGPFAAIICIATLQWLADLPTFFQETFERLLRNGQLVYSTPVLPEREPERSLASRVWRSFCPLSNTYLSIGEHHKLLTATGFANIISDTRSFQVSNLPEHRSEILRHVFAECNFAPPSGLLAIGHVSATR